MKKLNVYVFVCGSGYVTVCVTSLTPTPRLTEHMPPKYAALLLL